MEQVSLEFAFPAAESAKNAVLAVAPESGLPFKRRSSVAIKSNKNIVQLTIVASDRHSLNASEHSYRRLFGLCLGLCV